MRPENNNKRWTTTEIERVLLGGHRGDRIADIAATIGRTTKAVRQRANELGVGYSQTENGEVLKNEISHYELTGEFAGQEPTARTAEEVVIGIVENLTRLNNEDRFMYDLITGLTAAARVMSNGTTPTPHIDTLFEEPTLANAPVVIEAVVEVQNEVPKEVVIYKEKPVALPLDLSGNKVVEDIFSNGNPNGIIDVKRILGGNRSNFIKDGKSFHLGKKEEKITTGFMYTLTNSDTGMVLAQQKTKMEGNVEITVASKRMQ